MLRALLVFVPLVAVTTAQDRLPHMPRYDRYEKLRREIAGSVTRGDVSVRWAADSSSFTYLRGGTRYRFDLKTKKEAEDKGGVDEAPARPGRNGGRRNPDRGRQFDT